MKKAKNTSLLVRTEISDTITPQIERPEPLVLPSFSPDCATLKPGFQRFDNDPGVSRTGRPEHQVIAVYCQNCGLNFPVFLRCGDRTCPECRRKDYYRLVASYKPLLASKSRLRLITLTLRGRLGFLPRSRVARLRASFKTLLKNPYYKKRLTGGLYSIEAKRKTSGWNIHLHALAEGFFIDQKKLSNDWRIITGDSFVVDIRKAYSGIGGLKYILKYLVKAPQTLGYNQEYNLAFSGTRLISPFGNWYRKIRTLEKKMKLCPFCGSTNWITEFELFRLRRNAFERPG